LTIERNAPESYLVERTKQSMFSRLDTPNSHWQHKVPSSKMQRHLGSLPTISTGTGRAAALTRTTSANTTRMEMNGLNGVTGENCILLNSLKRERVHIKLLTWRPCI